MTESNTNAKTKHVVKLISAIERFRSKVGKIWHLVFPKKIQHEYIPTHQWHARETEPILSLEDWSGNDYIFKKPESNRRTIIRTKGKVHNIKKIFNRLNKEHFNGEIKAKITWGKYGCRNVQRFRSIILGTYSPRELLIRIHPAMDSIEVPEYFIEHVIHHEILHEVIPPIMGNGYKWKIHHYDFRVAEAATPSYKRAMEWGIKNTKNIFFCQPKGSEKTISKNKKKARRIISNNAINKKNKS